MNAVPGFGDFEVDLAMREREWMAKRDQFAGFLGSQDAGQARSREDVTFGDGLRLDECHGGFLKANFASCDRFAVQYGFGGDIDHAGFTAGIDVGEFLHEKLQRTLCTGSMRKKTTDGQR